MYRELGLNGLFCFDEWIFFKMLEVEIKYELIIIHVDKKHSNLYKRATFQLNKGNLLGRNKMNTKGNKKF